MTCLVRMYPFIVNNLNLRLNLPISKGSTKVSREIYLFKVLIKNKTTIISILKWLWFLLTMNIYVYYLIEIEFFFVESLIINFVGIRI